MKALYYLSLIILMLGVIAIPGCIEFNEGYLSVLIMIAIGAAGVLICPRYIHNEK